LSGLISYSVFSCLGMWVSSWAPPKTCFHNIGIEKVIFAELLRN
jgi:hypothetical protein